MLSCPAKAAVAVLMACAAVCHAAPADDAKTVADLDIAYQSAVLRGDADAMARIYHPDFRLISGKGQVSGSAEWLKSARDKDVIYEHQETIDDSRTVRVAGDTAVVTAKLWIKGVQADKDVAFNRVLWYSDTYVRTKDGWKYFIGQASLALPPEASPQTR
jgi:ketosteroid isomerase-like protein